MKLSTFNKIEAAVKTVTTLTAIGGAQAVESAVKQRKDEMTRELNAKVSIAAKKSYVGQKVDGMTEKSKDRYTAMRERITTQRVNNDTKVSATEE